MIEEYTLKIPRKRRLSFYLLEFASLIMGMILGAIITLCLLTHLHSKLVNSRVYLSTSPSFLGPYEDLAVVDIAQLHDEYMQFLLESMGKNKALGKGSQEYPSMAMLGFFEELHKAIDQVNHDKKVTVLDAKAISQLPDYTDEVREYLHHLKDLTSPFKETSSQKKEGSS